MRSELAYKKMIVMTKDWIKFNTATECHICNESLVKADCRDAYDTHNPNTGKYWAKATKGVITTQ